MSRGVLVDEFMEPERYELYEGGKYRFDLSRREFLKILGPGLLFVTYGHAAFAQRGRSEDRDSLPVSARLHIGADGTITVMTGKVEIGQGARAELTQAAAEELRVDPARIYLLMADTDLVPDDGTTAGSRTTPSTVPAVRKAAAAARKLLVEMACQNWKIDPAAVTVSKGTIREGTAGRSVTYAELAKTDQLARTFQEALPPDVEVTPVEQWQVMGTSVLNPNGKSIVTGAHRYPSDIVRPNMLYGKIVRPPSYGATLSSIDLSEAEAMEGVVVVRDGDFVGCAAPTSFHAEKAARALEKNAIWERPAHPSSKDLFAHLKSHVRERGGGWGRARGESKGSIEEGFAKGAKSLEGSFEISFIQHAPMEPRAAVAEWDNGKVTVWTGSQAPTRVAREVAEAFNLSEDKVRVIIPDMGGGFGGKHTGESAVEAARLARAANRPVSLRWTRGEEFTWAYFRPAGVIEVRGALDENGSLVAWDFTNINSGGSAVDSPYEIPNARSRFLESEAPLRQGSYRCLAATANNFAREVFMDELAISAGSDPLTFRLAHLTDSRLRDVLQTASDRFGWKERKAKREEGKGVGLACGTEKGSYVAACAEVAVDRAAGEIRALRITQVFECGAIINPDNLMAQVQGCLIMGLGGALTEEIHFEEGKILNDRFSKYRVPRFEDVPELDIHLLNRPDLASAGGGETPIIAVAPALSNAVFDATGIRLRSMPLRGELLKGA